MWSIYYLHCYSQFKILLITNVLTRMIIVWWLRSKVFVTNWTNIIFVASAMIYYSKNTFPWESYWNFLLIFIKLTPSEWQLKSRSPKPKTVLHLFLCSLPHCMSMCFSGWLMSLLLPLSYPSIFASTIQPHGKLSELLLSMRWCTEM